MSLPKYKYLLTYRYAEIIQDLTAEFCRLYILSDLSKLGHLGGRRTVEQMNAASRSNKQNIVEGVSEVASLKGQMKPPHRKRWGFLNGGVGFFLASFIPAAERRGILKRKIKLLGVSLASTEELTSDFEDFLRQRNLPIFPKDDPRISFYRKLGMEATSSYPPKLPMLLKEIRKGKTEGANLLLTLCHQLSYLLDRQIKSTENKFIKNGGYTENLLKRRLRELKLPK